MGERTPASVGYVLLAAVLWIVALPAVLVLDERAAGLPLRSWGPVVLGLAAAFTGLWLADVGARTLSQASIGLFGVVPGDRLVSEGIYARIRNPIDTGSMLMAVAPWAALDTPLMWVVPAGALVYFVAGVGPYEDRRLLEAFGDEFRDYRRSVPKWWPRRS